MSQKEIREARRRKVLERGSDRLAYITGEIKSISSSQSSSLNSALEPAGPVNPGETGLKSLSNAGGPAEPQQDSSGMNLFLSFPHKHRLLRLLKIPDLKHYLLPHFLRVSL